MENKLKRSHTLPLPEANLDEIYWLELRSRMPTLSRFSFPFKFLFGAASSAYQYEGAVDEDGRAPSIWDTFTKDHPEKLKGRSNGKVAVDFYHRYKEDVGLMKEMGLQAFRFSISWSRVLPSGKLSGGVNEKGISYYNNLINELVANGIEPFVTLFHWDLPQALETEYGGFLSYDIVYDFCDYAELCFKEFGDRVKYWITLNEPWTFSFGGYATGTLAPGRSSSELELIREFIPSCRSSSGQQHTITCGNSGTEPYVVSHHQLLAHAFAVDLYKQKYQTYQYGKIGITLVSNWMVPFSETKSDCDAAQRALDFMFGWFMDPLTTGDYPNSMKELVKDRLPEFSEEESNMLKGSFDFLGLNYYTANYAANAPNSGNENQSYITDSQVKLTTERNGIPIGEKGGSDWLFVYPQGIKDLLLYIQDKYNNPLIYITENGIDEVSTFEKIDLLHKPLYIDEQRIYYHHDHLAFVMEAIAAGVNVKGYFAWSLLDNFEWSEGYTVRFGIYHINYGDKLKRYPKCSVEWFKILLQ